MAIVTIEQLKHWFRKGLYPTQAQFWSWLDSYRHKNESIPMAEVSGLTEALNGKYERSEAVELEKNVNAAKHDMKTIKDKMDEMRVDMEDLENTLTDRTYTLDFGEKGTAMQDVNMEAEDVSVLEVRAFNCTHIWVTTGATVREEVNIQEPKELIIAAGKLATWEIEREADGVPAAVGVKVRKIGTEK